jgi:hypothetical protein
MYVEPAPMELVFLKAHVRTLEASLSVAKGQIAALEAEELRKERAAAAEENRRAEQRATEILAERLKEAERVRRVEHERRLAAAAAELERARLAEEAVKANAMRQARGTGVEYSLTYSAHFPKGMDDVKCMAIGSGGFIAVKDPGTTSSHGIYSEVSDYILRQQKNRVGIDYVAVGPANQFFVQNSNGESFFRVPDELAKEVSGRWVKLVALGPWGTYYVKLADGMAFWSRNIRINYPEADALFERGGIDDVWLGRDGAYFVRYNGSGIACRGLPHGVMQHVASGTKKIKQVLIDEERGCNFVRYSW